MRSATAIMAITLTGVCLTLTLAAPAFATGFARKHYTPRYGAPSTGMPHHPARYFRCRGGRYYTFLGGWGCDYYYPYYRPRRR